MTHESTHNRMAMFERLCRERGLPVTVQRRAIFKAMLDRNDHPTADQVHEQARARLASISRTTVYRILDNLVELGLITTTCHPGSAVRYDSNASRHHHLVCLECGSMVDLDEARLNQLSWPDVRGRGFEIHDYCIHFRGVCAKCRAASAAKANASTTRGKKPSASVARRSRESRPSAKKRRNTK